MTTNANIYTEASTESIEILIMTPNTAMKPCHVMTSRLLLYKASNLKNLILTMAAYGTKKISEK